MRWVAYELRKRGLIVWFDEWSISAGEDIFLAIERGLQESRVQFLFMSQSSIKSDWVSLERSTIAFRDPKNKDKRLIPVLIEKCSLPDTLKRLKYVDATKISKAKAVIRLIDALPNNIKQKISNENNVDIKHINDDDYAEYQVMQIDKELNCIASIKNKNVSIDNDLIDRVHDKTSIYIELDNIIKSEVLGCIYIFFIDVDGFTLINTKYGIFVGNQVLSIIKYLVQSVFKEDFVSYWSADEFVVSSTRLHGDEFMKESQALCNKVREYFWDEITPSLFVTVSIGIAKYHNTEISEETVDWFERAIIGCFNAKKNGGNQAAKGPEIGYRVRSSHNSLAGEIDVYKDYQWPIPEINYISSLCS